MKIVLCFLLIFFTAACNENFPPENSKPSIKIGVATPLSGAFHKVAEEMKRAEEFIVKTKHNPYFNYELIFEDTAGQAPRAISAAKKLINIDKVNIIISHISALSKVISPIATQHNILHIGTVYDANIKDNPTSFTFMTTADKKTKYYVEYLKKNNYKNIAVLVLNIATTQELYNGIKKYADLNDINITKYEFMPGQKDFTLDIQKIKNANHDQITLFMYPPELEILYKQLLLSDINIPLSTVECFSVANDPNLFNNVIYVDTYPGNEKRVNEIKENAKTEGTYYFAQLDDLITLIDIVLTKYYEQHKKIPTGLELTKEIIALKNFRGTSGEVTISPNRNIETEVGLLYLKNGKHFIADKH